MSSPVEGPGPPAKYHLVARFLSHVHIAATVIILWKEMR
jgi:hypothetical protein